MPQQFDFYDPSARFDPEARAVSNQRAVQNLQNFARQRQDIRNEEVLNRSRELQAIQQGKIQSDISQIDSTLTMGEKLTQAAGIYTSYGDQERANQALEGAERFQTAELKEQKIEQFEADGITRDMLAYSTRAASTIDNPQLFRSDAKARIEKLKREGRDSSDTIEMLDNYNDPDKGPEYVADYLDGLARESSVLLDIPYAGALDNVVRTANGDLVGISKATGEQVRIPAPEGMDFETVKGKERKEEKRYQRFQKQKALDLAKTQRKEDQATAKLATTFQKASKIRGEYDRINLSYENLKGTLEKIRSATDTGAGDISLIYGLMKLNDEGAAVQEGDKANVENAGGVPGILRSKYNKLIGGGTLGQKERDEFKAEAELIFNSQVSLYEDRLDRKLNLAKEFGISDVMITGEKAPGQTGDLTGNIQSATQAQVPGARQAADGKWYVETSPGKFSEVQQ